MLKFYRIWMHLLTVLLGLQLFLAGYGAIAAGAPAEAFELHIMNGRAIAAVTLLAIGFAALSRAGGKLVAVTAAVFALVVLQFVIAFVSVGGTVPGQIVFGFHAINGFIVMGVAEHAAKIAKQASAERAAAREAPAPAAA